MRDAAPYLSLGTTLAASVLLGLGIGYWLDTKLGWTPVLSLLGLGLGMWIGTLALIRLVNSQKKP